MALVTAVIHQAGVEEAKRARKARAHPGRPQPMALPPLPQERAPIGTRGAAGGLHGRGSRAARAASLMQVLRGFVSRMSTATPMLGLKEHDVGGKVV